MRSAPPAQLSVIPFVSDTPVCAGFEQRLEEVAAQRTAMIALAGGGGNPGLKFLPGPWSENRTACGFELADIARDDCQAVVHGCRGNQHVRVSEPMTRLAAFLNDQAPFQQDVLILV